MDIWVPDVDESPAVQGDYAQDREAARLSDMSAEDQAWQAASLEKERANREQKPPATCGPGPSATGVGWAENDGPGKLIPMLLFYE
jgi:hypothetical protein